MKAGFYPKLALESIKKNKRLYIPYLLTCIGMVMMHYIISFLHYADTMSHIPGADTARSLMDLGSDIVGVFAAIFLFYTNSFLIRRRKKEFGLYNILGMGKRNIARILFWEALIVTEVALGAGLFAGIVLSKLAELGLVNFMQGDVVYTLEISTKAVVNTVLFFTVIFALLFINTLCQLWRSNAIALLHSENFGEKPPKANWIGAIIGLLCLLAAYYISLTIESPVAALSLFFLAVILVMIGSYFLFISGSVWFCRILQRRKKYYYKTNHYVSVSSMVYRMKRNGAGLASICILATMVLVMISSTTSLYFGTEDSINSRNPKDINIEVQMKNMDGLQEDNVGPIRQQLNRICDKYSATPEDIVEYPVVSLAGILENNVLETDITELNGFTMITYSKACNLYFVMLDDYNRIMGEQETLGENEALVYIYRKDYDENTLTIKNGPTLKIKKHLDEFIANGNEAMNIVPTMYVVVSDSTKGMDGLKKLVDYNGEPLLQMSWTYAFDTSAEKEVQITLGDACKKALKSLVEQKQNQAISIKCDGKETNRNDFYARYGSLFFLGLILSIIFIFAAVLIIYYKQISEGYEDQDRFLIMQKVGMTKEEIRTSINSQLLTVFFMPLIGAALHLTFAFPSIRKLLLLFNLDNTALFVMATVLSFLLFALFYVLVYRITSNAYYKIVSGGKQE